MTGLRERKKQRTREAVQRVALRLFAEQGYEETTVEQVCAAAEVSPSTFFRYFASKQSLVLFDPVDDIAVAAFLAQPRDQSPLSALRTVVREVYGAAGSQSEAGLRQQLAMQVPALRDAWIAEAVRSIDTFSAALAEFVGRDGADTRVRVEAGAVLGVLLGEFFADGELSAPDDAAARIDAALDALDEGLPLLSRPPEKDR